MSNTAQCLELVCHLIACMIYWREYFHLKSNNSSNTISSKYFTLQEFNEKLINFNYGYLESSKPVPVLSQTLDSSGKSLRLSASEALFLTYLLPFIIGDKIPIDNDHWTCFLCLRKILDLVLSLIVLKNYVSSLKVLIIEHQSKFLELYGSGFYTPKIHFLMHFLSKCSRLVQWSEHGIWEMRQSSISSNKQHTFPILRTFLWLYLPVIKSRYAMSWPPTNCLKKFLNVAQVLPNATIVKEENEFIQAELSQLKSGSYCVSSY